MDYRYQMLAAVFAALLLTGARAEHRHPDVILRLPASVAVVFLAETSTAQFHRYERVGGAVKLTESYYMSIGRDGAGKQRSGDRRTPVGAYFVTEQLDTTRFHEKYGVMAFPLDYPNAWDHRQQRSGDGIWVHGVDPQGGRRPVRDTDGCIALPNEDLARLEALFVHGKTPVIVTETLTFGSAHASSELADQLASAVLRWAESVAAGDMHTYLSLYHQDFERWSMNYEEWAAFSLQTLAARPISDVVVTDLLLLRYPGEDELYLSRFRERITEAGVATETMRRLYWRRDQHGAFTIVAEDNG